MQRLKYHADRVIKRFLPWVFLLATGGMIFYLYYPYPETTLSPPQSEHDTASDEQSLIPEQTLTHSSSTTSSFSPKDENAHLVSTTTRNPKKPSLPSIQQILSKIPGYQRPSAPSTDSSEPLNTSEHTSHSQTSEATISSPIQEKTQTSYFEKKLHQIGKTDNAWRVLLARKINPTLLEQLTPLKKRLLGSFDFVEILYSDYINKGEISAINSKILAVRTNKWTLFSYEVNGEMEYYDINGNAPDLSMDRAPFAYTRITSPFDLHRRHPITHRIRPHEGVDLKGPYGTPIASTGDGIVTFAGWQNGYGRLVIINHNNDYETRYGHLSAIAINAGERVKRGQIIAKLGNSGISTGAHLHYEVRIEGIPYDPMTVKLPSYHPLPKSKLVAWKQYGKIYLEAIADIKKQGRTDK